MPLKPEEVLLVMGDALKERGFDWVFELVSQRQFLLNCIMSSSEPHYSGNPRTPHVGCGCSDRSYPRPHTLDRHHDPSCNWGRMIRLLGGPEVTQRQVNASHDQAIDINFEIDRLNEREAARGGPRRFHGRPVPEGIGLFDRLRREFNPSHEEMADPVCGNCEGTGWDSYIDDHCHCTQ